MKKHAIILSSLLLAFSACAQDMKKAEDAFEKGDFAAAKNLYTQLLENTSGDEKLQTQLRLAYCEYHLGEFLNAAKNMRSYPLPKESVWQARFLLYRIYTAKQASTVYRQILNKNEIVSTQTAENPDQWTQEQWQEKIDQDYRQLWSLRSALLKAPIGQENLILDLKDTDTKHIPTLFDFVVNSWTTYLQANASLPVEPLSKEIPDYLEGQARLKESPRKNSTLLTSQLLQQAANLEGENRQDARLFWKTDFILQPFNNNNFVIENQQKALDYALSILRPFVTNTVVKKNWVDQIKAYFSKTNLSQPDYARGYVAWRLADLLNSDKQYDTALNIIEETKKLPSSYFTQRCAQLAKDITRVDLSAQNDTAMVNRTQPELSLSGKNLKQVFVRVYKTSPDELRNLYKKHNFVLPKWSRHITHLEKQDIPLFLARTPLHQQTVEVPYEGVGKEQQTSFHLPTLDEGFYVVLMSSQENFSPKKNGVFGWVLNATDLAVFATAAIAGDPADYVATLSAAPKTLKPDLFHLYTVNLRTGEPEPKTSLRLATSGESQPLTSVAMTDEDGSYKLARSIKVDNKGYNDSRYYLEDVWAQKGESAAYLSNVLSFRFLPENPVRLFLQTDRPIYRPGQKVYISAQAFERLARGLKTLDGHSVSITIKDPNYKQIFTATPTLDGLGNARIEFTLPESTLLGRYSIQASISIKDRTYNASHSFSLEEYKRPDYELTLNPLQKPLVYGQKATLSGSAQYYFGAPLEKAKVTYALKRRSYVPSFYWWWFRPMAAEKIVTQGQTVTNEKGNFEFSFTPTRLEEDEEFANYELEAQVFDESGRAISATRSYKISAHPHLFKVEFAQGFYDANKTAPLAKINLVDADGNAVSGKITLSVSPLENRMPQAKPSASRWSNRLNLDELYQDFASKKPVFTHQMTFQKPGEQTLQLPALPEGVYRLELSSEKAAAQKMVFIVADEKSNLQLPDVALMQHDTYYPGETLRVLIGAGNLQGSKHVEVYQQNQFLVHQALLAGGVEVFTLPITDKHRGGVALRWFGASNYQLHSQETSVQIPFDNKELHVETAIPEMAKPGQTANWKITVKDASGRPANGLVNVTAYDKSLDYYAKNRLPFSFSSLYSQQLGVPNMTRNSQGLNTVAYYLESDDISSINIRLSLPTINLQMRHRSYGGFAGAKGGIMMMKSATADMALEEAAPVRLNAAKPVAAVNQALDTKSESLESEKAEEKGEDNSSIRTDFSETAYFNSALPLTNGQAALHFTLPQSLTTWNVLGFALTKQADFGNFDASFITRKDIMVRLQFPRFYREKDKGVIQAAVTNQTNRSVAAQVTLNIQKEQQPALRAFGVTENVKTVTVAPNHTQFVTWDITAPADPALYTLSVVARSGKESDGERKTIPVLPGRMRLLAATHKSLKNGNNTLQLDELSNVPADDVELISLKLNPSLALSVLNSMPNLLDCPYKDLVSSLNRYVPLAVVNKLYTTYPQLKQAVAKLPKRTGLTSSWNEKDPLRLQLLEQTPWLREAQGRQVHEADIINLFNDKIVSARLTEEMARIRKFQNSNGAFSWFPGGPDSEYMTLYALESFAQARSYKAAIPEESAKKAISYIVSCIEKRLRKDKTGSVASLSFGLYAAYTLSSFPQEWNEVAKAKPYIQEWLKYAESQSKFMTPLGRIHAAAIYYHLGDKQKANQYLDLVLSALKEDPLTGAYFAPEAQSWVWYNDTLTTQTLTLRTLVKIRPDSDKIRPMLQWLLFNRQVNDWTNSKAASQAVFAILEVMQAQGALSQSSSYRINWGGKEQMQKFEPFDWTADLQFVRQAPQITSKDRTAQINRQGPVSTTDFASLTAVYQASSAAASPKGVINVERSYFVREKQGTQVKLRPLAETENLQVGQEVEVHLTVSTDSEFEYVLLQDPKPAGFESTQLRSGWAYQNVSYYREEKEAVTNFFINWLPRGILTLHYTLQPSVAGKMNALPAQVQSMYAPQYGAHSASESFEVKK